MKKIRVALAYVLMIAMLLPTFSAAASAAQTISIPEQLVFDPLAESQSVAYERHASGYEVALSCDADGVTMDVTAVPANASAEGAELYIRTGVALKAGATYRVSYTLTAKQAVSEYGVCFDGAAENAYGAEKRSLASGTDLARCFVTPDAEHGELVLRLQLGKTPVNTFRFSDLAVEEATAGEIELGGNTVLVDHLDYNAPGTVRYWANDDYGAKMTTDGQSATMTVTKVPSAKEVWKLKILVSTGLFPEPGKAYRFRAAVNSTASQMYEVCYNEGETEKGYDVLYNQTLVKGSQTLDRTIYVSSDKTNPGELVVQLSLGMLNVGDQVTISDIRLEEASAVYQSVLPADFAFNKTWFVDSRTLERGVLSTASTNLASIDWANKAAVTCSGDNIGQLTVDRSGGKASLEIRSGVNSWDARLNIDTGKTLEANSLYRASVTVKSLNADYSNLEVMFGTAFANDFDIKDDYGALKGQTLTAGVERTITQAIQTGDESTGLLIQLFAGASGGADNVIEVSNVTIKKVAVDPSVEATPVETAVSYPGASTAGNFEMRDNKGELTGNGTSATYKCTSESGGGFWERGLFINDVATLTAGQQYQISFDIATDNDTNFEVAYNKDGNWGESEKGFGAEYGLSATSTKSTVTHTVTPEAGGKLSIRIDLGAAQQNTSATISNIVVAKYVDSSSSTLVSSVAYPSDTNAGSFEVRDLNVYSANPLSGDGTSADFLCSLDSDWQRGFWIHDVATLLAGVSYELSYKVKASGDATYRIFFSKEGDVWGGEAYFGKIENLHVTAGSAYTEVTQTIPNSLAGTLAPRFDITAAATDTVFSITDVKVTAKAPEASVAYPGSFEVRDIGAYDSLGGNPLSGDGSSVSFLCALDSDWQRGFWVHNLATLAENAEYEISYKVKATGDATYRIFFCDENNIWGGEDYFGKIENLQVTAGSSYTEVTHTIPNSLAGTLSPRFDVTAAATDTVFSISDIKVTAKDPTVSVSYPSGGGAHSFEVRDIGAYDSLGGNPLSGDGSSVSFLCALDSDWQRGFWVHNLATLTAGPAYELSYKIKATGDVTYRICLGDEENIWGGENYFGQLTGLTKTAGDYTEVKHSIPNSLAGKLTPRFDITAAATDTVVSIKDIAVNQVSYGGSYSPETISVTYPELVANSFEVRDNKGELSGDGASAVFTCTTAKGGAWERGLFANNIATLTAGKGFKVSFDIKASSETSYDVCYNKDGNWGASEKGFGAQYELTATNEWSTAEYTVIPAEDGVLSVRIDLGLADEGTVIEVKNFKVEQIGITETEMPVSSFGTVWAEQNGCDAVLSNTDTSAVLKLTPREGVDKQDWRAKLLIDTGVIAQANKGYRVSFDIVSTDSQRTYHVIYGYGGSGEHEKAYGERWNENMSAGMVKTITQDVYTNNEPGHPITVLLLLGLVDGSENTITVSNLRVYENTVGMVQTGGQKGAVGTATVDTQKGYTLQLSSEQTSATAEIVKTPESGAEPWKAKMFINPKVSLKQNEWYRVSMDVTARQDLDFEVCYNAGDTEKGFDAVYGLHASAGTPRRVEKVFQSKRSNYYGNLIVQLSLGGVPAPNAVTVSNLKVERIAFTYTGESAMPKEVVYGAQGDVSFWAHNDYTTELDGSNDAITVNVKKAPSFGAEPWKIKLFLDTKTPLTPGKFYKITTDLQARSPQNVEICYNNGGVEMGYDSIGGIGLGAGVKQTVEKLVSVPADMKDTRNLMLQVNLGAATSPNAITVSGVTVEEVSPEYANLMAQGYSYSGSSAIWTAPDYAAKLEASSGAATMHITTASASDPAVWKAKLLVHTGVFLAPGKSYVVRANMTSAKDLTYELCFNNEETEKGFDVLYGQSAKANVQTAIDKKISVPESMTDAGELVLQFSVGGPVANDVTVSGVSVQELQYGSTGAVDRTPATVITQRGAQDLTVTREKVTGKGSEIRIAGAQLSADDSCKVTFTAQTESAQSGTLVLRKIGEANAAMTQKFEMSEEAKNFAFTTEKPLVSGGAYELLWQFDGGKQVTLSNIKLSTPAEQITVQRSAQKVLVNGKAASPDLYNINGNNYVKLRDLAVLLNDTDAQFVVRYNSLTRTVMMTSGKRYSPIGGELVIGADRSASCVRSTQDLQLNGNTIRVKAYNLGGNNYFKIRALGDLLGFKTDYVAATNTVAISSPMTPEAQEASYTYDTFFRPEIDGEAQPFVGDTMAYYEDGTYYVYYLKEGGDSYNHSVYLATTKDFTSYTEYEKPVLSAARGDQQDSWIGTGSVVKVDGTYYFFYTGHTTSATYEFGETLLVAKSSNLTSFERVSGWEITPPAELGQKRDFRDPQAYYDASTGKITLTVTASKNGVASVLKYTLDKDLKNAHYDGVIFTDPTRSYWNLECTDTFKIGDTWYLTYSGQEDTLWYATSNSQFGPYSAPVQIDGKIFYAAKHVENGGNTYLVGWARRSESASSTQEVAAWGGNMVVQKVTQRADGSLVLAPVDSIRASFSKAKAVSAGTVEVSANEGYAFKQVATSEERFMLTGEFTYTGTGSFGLAFDFNGNESAYKLVSVNPADQTISLAFNKGVTKIASAPAKLGTKHSFTYVQDGSVGIFYVDGVASLVTRVYGSTGKPIYLFAENNSVTFTSLRCFGK